MRMHLIRPDELDATTVGRWREIQRSQPNLASPYFSPEFTLAVAQVRRDVYLTVMEENHGVVGFLPFQRRWGVGLPVGAQLSDHHGLVCLPRMRCDWGQLLRASGLSHWSFDHLPQAQAPHGRVRCTSSPGLDLSQGFAAYRSRSEELSRRIRKLESRRRQFARDAGPLRFEPHVRDRTVFDAVLRLKSQQFRRTGTADVFELAWTRALLERLWQTETPHFAGRLSALYAGDTLVAAHLGMRSEWAWHWWFPVYQQTLARHSPGLHLLLMVAEAAADQGHALLDLGKGSESYKESFADHSTPLVEGWVGRPSPATALLGARDGALRWLKGLPVLQPLRPLIRQTRSFW